MPNPSPLLDGLRATRAVVDLDAIAANLRAIRSVIPAQTQVMAVVKADAYGHGAPWVARAALTAGASSLGVATVGEGQELRAYGLEAPIVLLGSIDPSEAAAACRAGLEITIAHNELLASVQQTARDLDLPAPVAVHLKIDTGLRRYGALPDEAVALAARIAADAHLRFAGVFTHFASSDEPDDVFTADQLRIFTRAATAMREAGLVCPPLHVANSAAIFTGRGTDFDVVRAGIALYGVPPSSEVPLPATMRAALRLESRITRIVPIAPGDSVGYNRTFVAERSTRGALVAIGYADGYRRALSGRGWMGVGGRPAAVLGRVSMDQVVVAVPEGVDARIGDPVAILGGDPALAAPSALEMAELIGSNAYEVLVGIRRRVPRIFMAGGDVVAVRSAVSGPVAV